MSTDIKDVKAKMPFIETNDIEGIAGQFIAGD